MKLKTVFRTAVLCMASLCVFGGWAFASAAESREIPFSALDGVRVGNAQDDAGLTGVTVLCFPGGAKTGVDIRGGGLASRETPVLDPTKEDIGIHAIVLSGGSAYGQMEGRIGGAVQATGFTPSCFPAAAHTGWPLPTE